MARRSGSGNSSSEHIPGHVGYVFLVVYHAAAPDTLMSVCREVLQAVRRDIGDLRVEAYAAGDSTSFWTPQLYSTGQPSGKKRLSELLDESFWQSDGISPRNIIVEHYSGPNAPGRAFYVRPRFSLIYNSDHINSFIGNREPLRCLCVQFDLSYFNAWRPERTRDFIVELMGIITSDPACYHGLVDIAGSDETAGGRYYTESWHQERVAWQRGIEHRDWCLLEERRSQFVRGPYWGVYLYAEAYRRFDPDGTFAAAFQASALPDWPVSLDTSQSLVRYPSGGALIMCGISSLDYTCNWNCRGVVFETEVAVAAWLRGAFRARGMLM